MKALILNNEVVDIQETEFEVHSTMTWVDCDDTVKFGDTYDGTTFTPKITAEQITAFEAEQQTKADLKASAKAKLIAGEALTEDEANILIGV
jgi:hypothetical protein